MTENNDGLPVASPAKETPVTVLPPKRNRLKGVGEFVQFILTVVVVVVVVRVFIAQPFVVSGTSMVPTFQDANYLIVDEISYDFENPERGDVIIFHPPIDPSVYYIKRVIGLPGDTVDVNNGVVTITNTDHPNGIVLSEPYITPDNLTENIHTVVPAGNYFVMGDNRPVSYDSRDWGLLPRKNIAGRALLRLFPLNKINLFPGKSNATQNAN